VVGPDLAREMRRDPKLAKALDAIREAAVKLMERQKALAPPKCPRCKRGHVCEDSLGYFCSRRYAKRSPCDWWEAG
jgi:hypothetical protein